MQMKIKWKYYNAEIKKKKIGRKANGMGSN